MKNQTESFLTRRHFLRASATAAAAAPIHLIAQANSKVDHQDHPMAFVRDYGQGRVFLTTLGHDVKAFTNSSVPQLIRQGCAWAAKLPPRSDSQK